MAARELAVKQGLGVVLSGSIEREGNGYAIAVKATQHGDRRGDRRRDATAASKEQVLPVGDAAGDRRAQALGDETSESAQMFAMASLSATSLDVVRHYAAAQEASSNNKFEEARQSFAEGGGARSEIRHRLQRPGGARRATWASLQDAEKYINEALQYLDGMTERERFSTRGMFYRVTGDYQQCVKEYGELIARYAADVVGRNQLALCSTQLRDMPRRVEEMRQVVELLPQRALFRDNLALYANYAGDFQTGEAGGAGHPGAGRVRHARAGLRAAGPGPAAAGDARPTRSWRRSMRWARRSRRRASATWRPYEGRFCGCRRES